MVNQAPFDNHQPEEAEECIPDPGAAPDKKEEADPLLATTSAVMDYVHRYGMVAGGIVAAVLITTLVVRRLRSRQ